MDEDRGLAHTNAHIESPVPNSLAPLFLMSWMALVSFTHPLTPPHAIFIFKRCASSCLFYIFRTSMIDSFAVMDRLLIPSVY
jgi:hypothetical protein